MKQIGKLMILAAVVVMLALSACLPPRPFHPGRHLPPRPPHPGVPLP
jgi:hypothetical protein